MIHLQLDRPLVALDLETTSADLETARIVEIAMVKVKPDGEPSDTLRYLVNPGCPIPAEATAIHGIRDVDVEGAPMFRELAQLLVEFLRDSDITGFNVRRFDWPLLLREFERVGYKSTSQRAIVDSMEIFHKREPRDLEAAHRYYVGTELDRDTHSALDDACAALMVLEGQLGKYGDLPRSPAAIAEAFAGDYVDFEGKFRFGDDGRAYLQIGKHKGLPLEQVACIDSGYLEWIAGNGGFGSDTRRIAREALSGQFPMRAAKVTA